MAWGGMVGALKYFLAEFFARKPHPSFLVTARDLALGLIAAAAFARLGYLFVVPLELVGDESYYWDWGRQLAWGYFSKPPLIAWLMALGDLLGGGTAAGVRALAVIFGTVSLLAVFTLARLLYDARVGLVAVVTLLVTPANAASNLLLTIDAPLLACWTIGLAAAWRWLRPIDRAGKPYDPFPERRRDETPPLIPPHRWAMLVLLAVLGTGLLAKQMMMVFPVATLLWLAVDPTRRGWLKRPGLYVVLLLPFLAWLPPLWWNAQNDWITFQHTATHFGGGGVSVGRQVARFFEFLGSQAGIFTPVTWLLLVFLLGVSVAKWRQLGSAERFLLSYALPGLLVVLVMALRQRINPNWPAVFYPTAFVLLAAGVMHQISGLRPRKWLRPAWAGGVVLGLLLSVATYTLPWWSQALPAHADPTTRLRGWADLARETAQAELAVRDPEDRRGFFLVAGGHRYHTSAIAFYHPDQPTVYRWEEPGRVRSQYEVWGLPPALSSTDALIIWPAQAGPLPDALRAVFERIEPGPERPPEVDVRYARPVDFYVGRGWRGLPEPSALLSEGP